MRIIFIYILFFCINISQIDACRSCITQVSQKHSNLATRTVHAVKKATCNCPCNGPRSEKNECLECECKIAAHK